MKSTDIIIPFGKYKNKSLDYILKSNPGYLSWMATEDSMNDKWKEAARLALSGKEIPDSLKLPFRRANTVPDSELMVRMRKFKKNRISVEFPLVGDIKDRFKHAIDGRRWDPDLRKWSIPLSQVCRAIDFFHPDMKIDADDYVKSAWKAEKDRRESLDHIREQEDSDIEIKTKHDLYPYQKVAVQFVNRANGRALIGDQMGVGKTITAIGYAVYHNHKTLIIAPKSVLINWKREIEKFTGKTAVIWTSSGRDGRTNSKFHIINYDAVTKYVDELNDLGFDLLVCDEATNIKNKRTKRAKTILGDWKQRRKYPGIKTKDVLFLTGTPVLNSPVEAFNLLSFLDKTRFNNFLHFVERYGGFKGEPTRNLEELYDRTQDLIIRRSYKDINHELPDKQRNDIFIELTPSERKQYNACINDLFDKWKFQGKPSVQHLPKLQNFLFSLKKQRIIEMVEELLSNDRGVLIFSVYKDPLYQLKDYFKSKAVMITGDVTNQAERQQAIDALSSGEAKIGLFTVGTGAMGIDGIQKQIDVAIFLNMWFVPGIHDQAEGRLYRTGQKNKVQIYYTICENTTDEYMRELLSDKQKMIDQIVDGKIVNFDPQKSFFKEFIIRLNREHNTDFAGSTESDVELEID